MSLSDPPSKSPPCRFACPLSFLFSLFLGYSGFVFSIVRLNCSSFFGPSSFFSPSHGFLYPNPLRPERVLFDPLLPHFHKTPPFSPWEVGLFNSPFCPLRPLKAVRLFARLLFPPGPLVLLFGHPLKCCLLSPPPILLNRLRHFSYYIISFFSFSPLLTVQFNGMDGRFLPPPTLFCPFLFRFIYLKKDVPHPS